MFLFYIASGIVGMILFDQASKGDGTAARLASIATHAPQMGLSFAFALIGILNPLILGLALYALTRDEDPDIALLAFACRVVEGAINAVPVLAILALLFVATTTVPDAMASNAIGPLLLTLQGWSITVGATIFAVGSTLYSYLFLRARTIPVWLAWLGVLGSLQLIITVPLAGLRVLTGAATGLMWLPMLIFEVTLGVWLLVKGAKLQPTLS